MLWATLIVLLQQSCTRADAKASFVAGLPCDAVQHALIDQLYLLTDGHGALLPAGHDLNDGVDDRWSVLQMLAVHAQLLDHLDGGSRDAFLRSDLLPASVSGYDTAIDPAAAVNSSEQGPARP